MRLKHLEIRGFKSFANKTKIEFDVGKTAIVGPNGSGKSNVSDAMHWVLGEQSSRSLRAKTMTDLIFNGTQKLKAQSYAEVSLVFDNTSRGLSYDSDEVRITRRVERSGDSEYRINSEQVTLKRIQEMLRDTGLGKEGYAMVRQGRIDSIVQSRSADRRQMFEEAAGIATFRHRKNEAQRDLDKAEENIIRLNDILSVLEKQVGPLKAQAEKAKEYLELAGKSKTIEISLWINELNQFNRKKKDESDSKLASQLESEEIAEKLEGITAAKLKAFEESQACTMLQEKLRMDKAGNIDEIARLGQVSAVAENNISRNNQDIEKANTEISSLENNKEQVLIDIRAKEDEIITIQTQIDEYKSQVSEYEAKLMEQSQQNEAHSKEEQDLIDTINQINLDKSGCNMELSRIARELEDILTNSSNETEDKQKYDETLGGYNDRLQNAQNFFDTLEDKRTSLKNSYDGHNLKLKKNQEKLDSIKQENIQSNIYIAKIQNELTHLKNKEESMMDFGYSVKEVLTQAKNGRLNGIIGTVSQLVEVDPRYTTAIETALGGAMQNIVVENESNAKAGINMLFQSKKGRATFLPLTSVKGNKLYENGLDKFIGYVGLASELIKFDSTYTGIFNSLLGRIVIVDDLDTATTISKQYGYKFRIVTLGGQVVNAGGSFTGGSKNKGQAFLSQKNDINEKQNLITEEQSKYEQNQQLEKDLTAECGQIQAEFNGIASELATLKEDERVAQTEKNTVTELKEQLEQAMGNYDKLKLQQEEKKQKLMTQNDEFTNKLEELATQLDETNTKLGELKQEILDSSDSKNEITDEITQLGIKDIELNANIRLLQSQIDALKDSDENRAETIAKYQAEIERLTTDNNTLTTDIEANNSEVTKKEQENTDIDVKITQSSTDKLEHEATTNRLVKEERDISVEQERVRSKLISIEEKERKIQEDEDKIIRSLQEQYELTKLEAVEIAEEIEDIEKAKGELNVLKGKIRGLGSVNPNAIEEYQKVSEEYELLSTELADVNKSKKGLIALIDELLEEMTKMFLESFNEINRNFKVVFVDMFGGGSSNLRLTDMSNPLESGIEIIVQPPGKKIGDLMELSGGEKALIAIAIYFSIFTVRPSPFCILDEIDAPLDDINVDRFAQYLGNFVEKVQFIVITHRIGSMLVADAVHGVVMPGNSGVSMVHSIPKSEVGQDIDTMFENA